MRKVTRKDNRFSIAKEKAKRSWGMFYATQPQGGRASLTSALAPQPHTPTQAPHGHQWENIENFPEAQGDKETKL